MSANKYTYQLSFNGSDYSDLVPDTIQMDGSWIAGTKIWRENISSVHITKSENSDIYDMLASWFTDSSKFSTRIYIKIIKLGVQESLHWFGIKWGTINEEKKTYTVQPIAFDKWAQYFENVYDMKEVVNSSDYGSVDYIFYDDTIPYSPGASDYFVNTFIQRGKQLIGAYTDFTPSDYVSTILNCDDYEDSTSVTTEYGIKVDYVTGEQSLLRYSGSYFPVSQSLKEYFDNLQLLQLYPFFDSNDQLRIEHSKFFIDKLEDNAVDISNLLEAYDEEFSYDTTETPSTDKITMANDDEDLDDDFVGYTAIYDEMRNRPDAQAREFTSILRSNLDYFSTDDPMNYIFAPNSNIVWGLTYISGAGSMTSDRNYFDITADALLPSIIDSNLFVADYGESFEVTVNVTSITGTVTFEIYDNTAEASESNIINVSVVGETTGTLTTTRDLTSRGAKIHIGVPSGGAIEGYIVVYYNSNNNYIVPQVEGFASGSYKTNAHFSVANIFNNYWNDNGLSRSCTYNGDTIDFDNTEYNLRRKDVKFYYDGNFNPLYGVNDGTRIGMIEKWKRVPETGFYQLSIIYQEDE